MKLWVDDLRKAPAGYVECRTVTEAIRFLDTHTVEMVSLDHDITHAIMPADAPRESLIYQPVCCPETFEPVARFIANNPGAVNHVHFQTANPGGGERMADIIRAKQPNIRITKATGRSYEETQDQVIG